jgi:hypothetical protein
MSAARASACNSGARRRWRWHKRLAGAGVSKRLSHPLSQRHVCHHGASASAQALQPRSAKYHQRDGINIGIENWRGDGRVSIIGINNEEISAKMAAGAVASGVINNISQWWRRMASAKMVKASISMEAAPQSENNVVSEEKYPEVSLTSGVARISASAGRDDGVAASGA